MICLNIRSSNLITVKGFWRMATLCEIPANYSAAIRDCWYEQLSYQPISLIKIANVRLAIHYDLKALPARTYAPLSEVHEEVKSRILHGTACWGWFSYLSPGNTAEIRPFCCLPVSYGAANGKSNGDLRMMVQRVRSADSQ